MGNNKVVNQRKLEEAKEICENLKKRRYEENKRMIEQNNRELQMQKKDNCFDTAIEGSKRFLLTRNNQDKTNI